MPEEIPRTMQSAHRYRTAARTFPTAVLVVLAVVPVVAGTG
ncbi:hypothetical protein ACFFUA_17140 [Streptomyces heliomycini]|uniref:Uncharacterized protein n=1 Tax=Streptomyces heliomycini TaxID=284032 RepID=A0ABV5LCA7_9ACTN|nr:MULTISPECIES: hypothetical protein [Streptomyces]